MLPGARQSGSCEENIEHASLLWSQCGRVCHFRPALNNTCRDANFQRADYTRTPTSTVRKEVGLSTYSKCSKRFT